MPVVLTNDQIAKHSRDLTLAATRLAALSKEQPDHVLVSRLYRDAEDMVQAWNTMPLAHEAPEEDATIGDLIDAIQEELPTASVTIMIPSRPRQ